MQATARLVPAGEKLLTAHIVYGNNAQHSGLPGNGEKASSLCSSRLLFVAAQITASL
jgi:hypothetical protein